MRRIVLPSLSFLAPLGALTAVVISSALPAQAAAVPYSCNPLDGAYIYQYWSTNGNMYDSIGTGYGQGAAVATGLGSIVSATGSMPDRPINNRFSVGLNASGDAVANSYSEINWVLGDLNLANLESTMVVQDLTFIASITANGTGSGSLNMSGSTEVEGLIEQQTLNANFYSPTNQIVTFQPLTAIGGPFESVRVTQYQTTSANAQANLNQGNGGYATVMGTTSLNAWIYGVTPEPEE